jgi:hypothetical protein
MTNKEKYKTQEERKEAHDEWCLNKTRRCCSECDHCFNNWLDLDVNDTEGNDICYAEDPDEWYWRVEFPLGLQDLEDTIEENSND